MNGNFCVDGLVAPDRTPHAGLLELKNVQRPARVVDYDQERGLVTPPQRPPISPTSTSTSRLSYELRCDGASWSPGRWSFPAPSRRTAP